MTVACYLFQPTKLNVYKNDAESWDYTTPTLGEFALFSLSSLPQFSFFLYFLLSVLCTCNFITYTNPRVSRHAFQQMWTRPQSLTSLPLILQHRRNDLFNVLRDDVDVIFFISEIIELDLMKYQISKILTNK